MQDEQLREAVKKCSEGKSGKINWEEVARLVDGETTSRQCFDRWCKHVNPELEKYNDGLWTAEEVGIQKWGVHACILTCLPLYLNY